MEVPEVVPAAPAPTAGRAATVISILLLLVSVGFSIAGQITLKSAMNRVGRIGSAEVAAAADTIVRVAKEPRLWLGLTLFGISSLFWMVVLSRVPLSVAYPFVGISYVVIVLMSHFVLNENVPALRWIGVLVVAAGITIIGLSFRRLTGA
jgi:multidrug transporter EmrE-like cation transporter